MEGLGRDRPADLGPSAGPYDLDGSVVGGGEGVRDRWVGCRQPEAWKAAEVSKLAMQAVVLGSLIVQT